MKCILSHVVCVFIMKHEELRNYVYMTILRNTAITLETSITTKQSPGKGDYLFFCMFEVPFGV